MTEQEIQKRLTSLVDSEIKRVAEEKQGMVRRDGGKVMAIASVAAEIAENFARKYAAYPLKEAETRVQKAEEERDNLRAAIEEWAVAWGYPATDRESLVAHARLLIKAGVFVGEERAKSSPPAPEPMREDEPCPT